MRSGSAKPGAGRAAVVALLLLSAGCSHMHWPWHRSPPPPPPPVRIAFRVRPGTIGVLDVRGAERTLLPINGTGTSPVDLELGPGMFTPTTTQMTVSWGPS